MTESVRLREFNIFMWGRQLKVLKIFYRILIDVVYNYINIAARIDVEAPEFESEAFRVMVFRNLDIQVSYYI